MLFGKVRAVLAEPGIYFLWFKLGLAGPIINLLGKRYILDLRLDQTYLRSQAVNSEEGAPMGIGIWYEMFISDPVAFLFKNADPRGSLAANVSNATVRCLSNMKLGDMLENRHAMSQTVRAEVSPKSKQWGYQLGSIYIRKVHFRDVGMIRQIEEKVVNRLRQVTSAIKQDGANQVSIITSTAEREAAIEFAQSRRDAPADRRRSAPAHLRRSAKSSTRCSISSKRKKSSKAKPGSRSSRRRAISSPNSSPRSRAVMRPAFLRCRPSSIPLRRQALVAEDVLAVRVKCGHRPMRDFPCTRFPTGVTTALS